ncbi:hypothetical protein BDR07DRAFT_1491834 [Suillus spraguei]|nr:hypothetical protein BDR07DRAFT_1491834 [Suillus spraguei]
MSFPTAYITPVTIANNDSDSGAENYGTLTTEIDNTSYIEAALLCEGHALEIERILTERGAFPALLLVNIIHTAALIGASSGFMPKVPFGRWRLHEGEEARKTKREDAQALLGISHREFPAQSQILISFNLGQSYLSHPVMLCNTFLLFIPLIDIVLHAHASPPHFKFTSPHNGPLPNLFKPSSPPTSYLDHLNWLCAVHLAIS